MKRKPVRIENPFSTLPQCQPNLRRRISAAEGQEDIRRLNSEGLTCYGYQMDTAGNGTTIQGFARHPWIAGYDSATHALGKDPISTTQTSQLL
jgi:hypothetical protein